MVQKNNYISVLGNKMKNVLSQLHNIINSLQNNNLVKEAEVLDKVFTKLADRGKRWNEVIQNTERPGLKDENGEPDLSITDYSLGRREDAIIQNSTAYQNLKNKWIAARDAYVASKKLSMMGNRSNQNKLISTYPNEQREDKLRAKWLAAEQDLEIWYIGAFVQVKANKPVPQIMNLQLEDITDEKRKRNRSTVKPEVKQTAKPAFKPVVKQVVKQKPATPQVTKPKPVEQKDTAPVTTNQTTRKPIKEIGEPEITRRAQEYLDMLKSRVVTQNEKIWQAYAFLQFIVYREDTTTGKFVYRKWQEMVDEYKEQQQQQQQPTTTTTTPSAPSTPSTSPTTAIEV